MSQSASFELPSQRASGPSRSRGAAISDVRLFHTPDGGEVEIVGGTVTMGDGLETAVYLSLFGGNERDRNLEADDRLQWWGNLDERDESRRYRSETQALLRALPATTASLRRLEDAVSRDLAWLEQEIASALEVTVSIPRVNAIAIDVVVVVKFGTRYPFQFASNWGAQR